MKFIYPVAFSVVFGFVGNTFAVELPEVVNVGMSYGQVLKIMGSPNERQVREAKREDLWIYDKESILLREGRVVALASKDQMATAAKLIAHEAYEKKAKQKKQLAENKSDEVDLILKDIIDTK